MTSKLYSRAWVLEELLKSNPRTNQREGAGAQLALLTGLSADAAQEPYRHHIR